MVAFRKPTDGGATKQLKSSKWDPYIVVSSGKEYRPQAQSGRTAVVALASEGMTIRQVTEAAMAEGYEGDFARGAILKHCESRTGKFIMQAPEGLPSVEEMKRTRWHSDPDKQADRERKAAEKAAAKEAREAERAAKKEAKEQERLAKLEAKRQAVAEKKATKKAERDAAKAAAAAGETPVEEPKAKKKKDARKGKRKAKEGEGADPSDLTTAESEAA